MKLEDMYKIFRSAGMPESPLVCFDDVLGWSLSGTFLCRECNTTEKSAMVISEDTARDLLTMHVLRWFLQHARSKDSAHEILRLNCWTTYAMTSLCLGIDGDASVCYGESDGDCDILGAIASAIKEIK